MAENWHKRQALQLASQLPDEACDVAAIMRELQYLVNSWLHVSPEPMPSNVVNLVRDKV